MQQHEWQHLASTTRNSVPAEQSCTFASTRKAPAQVHHTRSAEYGGEQAGKYVWVAEGAQFLVKRLAGYLSGILGVSRKKLESWDSEGATGCLGNELQRLLAPKFAVL